MGSVRVLSDNRCIPIENHLRLAAAQGTGFTRAREYQIFRFACVTIATAMRLAIPRERRMVASCSWRPERDEDASQACQQIISADRSARERAPLARCWH